MTSPELRWYRVRWPREVEAEQVTQVCRLLATTAGEPVILEVGGRPGHVEHRLALPVERAGNAVDQLRAAIPGLGVEVLAERIVAATHAVELRLNTRRRPLRTEEMANSSRALLTALAHLERGEYLTLQWVLGRAVPAMAVPNRLIGFERETWLGALLAAPFSPPQPVDPEVRSALRAKQAEPGWRVIGRIGVMAKTPARERQLVRQVVGALGSTAAPGVSFRVRPTRIGRVASASVGWRFPLRLNVNELANVAALPVGPTSELPVPMIGSRLLPPSDALRRHGLVVGQATFPGRERSIAITPKSACRHIHCLGPSGVGKSTLLINLVVSTMRAGRALVAIDPKGDLIADIAARTPAERISDVVIVDPGETERPVGFNPLASHGRSPELVADQLLGLWHARFASSWGPRTADILGAALLTAARTPGMTLPALIPLLTDAGFRRRIVAGVADPIALGPFWSAFENWSDQERVTATAPVMNKLRPLLRREVRNIIGQSQPRFDISQVFTERKILLVNLNRGILGPEASTLLGSLLVSLLWSAILGRAAIAPERRHPTLVILDEFQSYLHLHVDLADALAMSRGMGVGFALAHQYLHQADPAMRSSLLANAQSRITWRLSGEDARIIASGSALAPEDFQSLGAFEAYAQLVANDAVQPWCSLKTLPASARTSDPAAVRAASRVAYGVDRASIEAELHELFVGRAASHDADLKPRRLGDGGGDA